MQARRWSWASLPRWLGGAFSLAQSDESSELLLTGGLGEDQVTDDKMRVRETIRIFNQIRVDALRECETQEFLQETMEQWNP